MCLVGVVVRRYIDFLILLIPYISALFLQQHPYFLFIFKTVFLSCYYRFKTYKIVCIFIGPFCRREMEREREREREKEREREGGVGFFERGGSFRDRSVEFLKILEKKDR